MLRYGWQYVGYSSTPYVAVLLPIVIFPVMQVILLSDTATKCS
ncbi:MAG: hypothetical protein ACRBB5_06745 [Nitrosopumilus sp.]